MPQRADASPSLLAALERRSKIGLYETSPAR